MRMKRHHAILSLILLCAVQGLAQDEGLSWLGSYREALQEARSTQKPIFLEFRCEP
jgi:hypothetical protein